MTPDSSTLPLRDIHLPPPVGWWPPAPGWWILAGVLLLAIGAALVLRRAHRRRALRRAAERELAAIAARQAEAPDPGRLAMELSMLARRIAVRLAGPSASAVTGEDWLALLDSLAGTSVFREGPGRALASAPYMPREAVPAEALMAAARAWIARLPAVDPRGPKKDTATGVVTASSPRIREASAGMEGSTP